MPTRHTDARIGKRTCPECPVAPTSAPLHPCSPAPTRHVHPLPPFPPLVLTLASYATAPPSSPTHPVAPTRTPPLQIRLTDVRAVEDALDTLQHGSFAADRDRLSPANCVQLFRLLQLAVEYLAHLRSAHALLLDCYNAAIAAAERWGKGGALGMGGWGGAAA